MLEKWLDKVQPQKVVEWGPGRSTQIILERCPTASVLSIEHDPSWFMRAQGLRCSRLDLMLIDATSRNSNYATQAYSLGSVDFAFVDGRRRAECALVALSILRKGGVVMLHDWCRKNYQLPLQHYAKTLEHKDNTVVLIPRITQPVPS